MKDVSHYKLRLEERLRELKERIHVVESELDEEPNADFAERAVEREGDEVLESLGQASVNEMRMIQAALERIEHGTYGECVNCGERISEKRLDLVPHASRCVNCA